MVTFKFGDSAIKMYLHNLFIAFIFLNLISCKEKSAIDKQLSGSDSLVINFNEPGTLYIAKTLQTSEVKAIDKLVRFVDGSENEISDCRFDGNLMFYKEEKLLGDISFNYSVEGCLHFMLMLNNKHTSIKMGNEAVDFLKSLANGKDWY